MNLTMQQPLPPQLQQLTSQLIYQATEDLQQELIKANQRAEQAEASAREDRQLAYKYRTEIEPLKLLESTKNQLTIRYRTLQDQERLDRLRVRLGTFNPPRFPYAMRAWFLWREKGPLGGYHKPPDPAYLFLSRLLEIYDEHPELVAELINSPIYSGHFEDMVPVEVTVLAAAAAAAVEKLNEV